MECEVENKRADDCCRQLDMQAICQSQCFGTNCRLLARYTTSIFQQQFMTVPQMGFSCSVSGHVKPRVRRVLKECDSRFETGINAEINQQNIDRVLDAVGNDRGEKISIRGKINR